MLLIIVHWKFKVLFSKILFLYASELPLPERHLLLIIIYQTDLKYVVSVKWGLYEGYCGGA